MKKLQKYLFLIVIPMFICCSSDNKSVVIPRGELKLDRGMVAVRENGGPVYIGWRLLESDPAGLAFDIYRLNGNERTKINEKPITSSTNFVDLQGGSRYALTATSGGRQFEPPTEIEVWEQNYRSIKLQGDYSANRVGIADLDGDGVYDFIVKQPGGSLDPGTQRRSVDTYKYEAYNGKTGELMWRYDLGWNMDMGIWWTPAIVFDFNGDGKAEVAFKGSVYAATEEESFLREDNLFILEGPEYCIVLDGETGKEITRADWIPRGDPESWGDPRGNRVNRNQIGVAYLDGKTPSLLVCRGTYTKMFIDAYNLVGNQLVKVWGWCGDDETPQVRGQGFHGMHAYDVDGDGFDEIIFGDAVLDHDGKILWNMNMGHPDICYLADIDPDRPGLELFYAFESRQQTNGFCVVDPLTGHIIWGIDTPTIHLHDWGMIGNIDPTRRGMELYAREQNGSASFLCSAKGELISDGSELGGGCTARAFYWKDGDVKVFYPFAYGARVNPIMEFRGEQIGEIPGTIVAIADIYGDWREEVVSVLNGEIRIYTTTIPSTTRRPSLMQDPLYRMDVAQLLSGYIYVPQLSRPW